MLVGISCNFSLVRAQNFLKEFWITFTKWQKKPRFLHAYIKETCRNYLQEICRWNWPAVHAWCYRCDMKLKLSTVSSLGNGSHVISYHHLIQRFYFFILSHHQYSVCSMWNMHYLRDQTDSITNRHLFSMVTAEASAISYYVHILRFIWGGGCELPHKDLSLWVSCYSKQVIMQLTYFNHYMGQSIQEWT